MEILTSRVCFVRGVFLAFFVLIFWVPQTKTCNILSLSGGGAHGAFQGGVLYKLHQQNKKWDIITGISVGSLNGMMLGLFPPEQQSAGIELIKSIWTNITGNSVYHWNWDPIYDQSLLDNSALRKTINTVAIEHGGKARRDIIIGAVSLNTGLLRLFNRNNFTDPTRTTNIVMASSSIPVVFPPTLLDNEYYIDGGTFTNEIIRPAIHHCLDKGYPLYNITIDIIICDPPIDQVASKEIKSDTIFGLGSRAYDIIMNTISNHELFPDCNRQKSIPINVYKPYSPYPGGLLDFSHKDLVKMFEIGRNIDKPVIGKYCY